MGGLSSHLECSQTMGVTREKVLDSGNIWEHLGVNSVCPNYFKLFEVFANWHHSYQILHSEIQSQTYLKATLTFIK